VLDDRFRVDEPISEGGLGKVYRGTQTKVGRAVAIKVLSSDLDRPETQMRRFLREARTLSQLSHPNIVNFIDSGQDPRHEAVYLVMELIEGDDLSELVGDDRIHPALLTEIGIQVCSALAEPHDAGMIHRALKPANLMLSSRVDGALETKIVDFGITNVVHDETRLTKQGNVCGTPHYMAPEQVEGGPMTPAADVYALGAIFFHLLTGTVVFEGKSDIQVLFGHVQKPAPSPSRIAGAPGVPEALGHLVGAMLAKSPGDRPGSALVVRGELEAMRREHGFPAIRIDPDLPLQRAIDQWIYRADTASRSLDRPVTGEVASRPETGAEKVAGSAPSTDPSAQSLRVSEQVDGASARERTAQIAVDSSPAQPEPKRDREPPSISGSGPGPSGS
ncbi:MAG: serine/threonine-protein kinase, partial [Bradymonadaceae bacterium]